MAARKAAPRKVAANRKAATQKKKPQAKREPKSPDSDKKLPGFCYICEPHGYTLTTKEKARFKKFIHSFPAQHFIQADAPAIVSFIDIEIRLAELRTYLRNSKYWLTEDDKGSEQEHPYVKLETRWLNDREKLAKQLRVHPTDRDRLFGYGNAVPVEPEDTPGQLMPPMAGRRLVFRESDVIDAEYSEIEDRESTPTA